MLKKRMSGAKGKFKGKGKPRKGWSMRKKVCEFCRNKSISVDYKDLARLQKFTTERGKILPNRISGNCPRHQREVSRAIKRARTIALLPYIAGYK